MAAGIIGANIVLNAGIGKKSVNQILGGTNTYEKVIVNVVQTKGNPIAVYIGDTNITSLVFGMILKAGESYEFYSGHGVASAVNIGANLFFLNPSSEDLRLDVLGFATA